ncbi:phosphoribosylanthranilate isomerase [Dongia sp.]|uniref:phosphoribosylanthranilate isomerase n=1 Tax=Dongia sp. TaxID=1977262 RepID=UPI0035B2B72E
MPVDVKICGLKTPAAVQAAVDGGAAMLGFNFYARSSRCVTPALAAALGQLVPAHIVKVGLVVDADDAEIAEILAEAKLDMLQLHGSETVARTAEVRRRFGLPVMKAISVSDAADIAAARTYESVADMLLFDAKPPKAMKDALPGGNALSFDWSLLKGQSFSKPWLLAGGLNAGNVAEAVRETGAKAVDLSSGVEDRPGEKNISKIKEFLELALAL